MAYPRTCPICQATYGLDGPADLCHVTVNSEPGGTPSPWRSDLPGRILTLRCLFCEHCFGWDYFGNTAQQLAVSIRPRASNRTVEPGRAARRPYRPNPSSTLRSARTAVV